MLLSRALNGPDYIHRTNLANIVNHLTAFSSKTLYGDDNLDIEHNCVLFECNYIPIWMNARQWVHNDYCPELKSKTQAGTGSSMDSYIYLNIF